MNYKKHIRRKVVQNPETSHSKSPAKTKTIKRKTTSKHCTEVHQHDDNDDIGSERLKPLPPPEVGFDHFTKLEEIGNCL